MNLTPSAHPAPPDTPSPTALVTLEMWLDSRTEAYLARRDKSSGPFLRSLGLPSDIDLTTVSALEQSPVPTYGPGRAPLIAGYSYLCGETQVCGDTTGIGCGVNTWGCESTTDCESYTAYCPTSSYCASQNPDCHV